MKCCLFYMEFSFFSSSIFCIFAITSRLLRVSNCDVSGDWTPDDLAVSPSHPQGVLRTVLNHIPLVQFPTGMTQASYGSSYSVWDTNI